MFEVGRLDFDSAAARDALPEAYRRWRASRLGSITDALEERLVLELAGPVEGRRVLDIGCGDGALVAALARRGAIVTGLDRNPVMLAAARARLDASGLETALCEGDGAALLCPDNTFDLVTAVTVLCFVADATRVLAEIARVLRPGGRLVIGELGRWSLWAARRRVASCLGHKTWRAATFQTAGELRGLVRSAGLHPRAVRGAIFYPPCGVCASLLAPIDYGVGRLTTAGAAFIAVAAVKPVAT